MLFTHKNIFRYLRNGPENPEQDLFILSARFLGG